MGCVKLGSARLGLSNKVKTINTNKATPLGNIATSDTPWVNILLLGNGLNEAICLMCEIGLSVMDSDQNLHCLRQAQHIRFDNKISKSQRV